ncbi:MAG: peptide ABC transporter substrate-binding protein [Bacteroidetes bacterium]|nr:peptide ABC transporter substrate-binding protein [Bacteroidota bacterium]
MIFTTRIRIYCSVCIAMLMLIYSCNNQSNDAEREHAAASSEETFKEANGGRYYGGVFRLNESESFETLFPLKITDAISSRVATQVYEGLLKFNATTLAIEPSIAESWELDEETRTVYTFKLIPGVLFHDDACFPNGIGREVTAEDFKYCFEMICTAGEHNTVFNTTFKDVIKGATQYYTASKSGKPDFDVEGIKVIDSHTLEITLERSMAHFIYLLAMQTTAVFPREAYEMYGTDMTIGTGPFKVVKAVKNEAVHFTRNDNYYVFDDEGNQLPFLDSLIIYFMKDKDDEVDAFIKRDLDMVYKLSTDQIFTIVEADDSLKELRFQAQRNPEMLVQYYEFLTQHGIFTDKRIRQAFNHAVDRKHLVNRILDGAAHSDWVRGITPPSYDEYDINNIMAYEFDIAKAQRLMAAAGYPNGDGFPELSLDVNPGGGRNIKVAKEVLRQLKENLNITVTMNEVDFKQKNDRSKVGASIFVRSAWRADYPNPQNFLSLFYGQDVPTELGDTSYPNTSRYVNPEFDRHYESGMGATSTEDSYMHYMKAENIMMKDAPIMVLFYDENYRYLQPFVRNFVNNAMQFRDLSEVWFDYAIKQQLNRESETTDPEPET